MSNRLANESSPYLQQHRDNPVDWYPWGPEGLERARAEDRPILLSIGYSACHWCHVMERESFEDEDTAALMNEHFINIKVDREERPDIDSLYMAAVQQMTGHGGWPMTVFLTPDGAPFYGGTYFPPAPRHGLPSFRQVLEGVSQAFRERRETVNTSAGEMLAALRESISLRAPAAAANESVLASSFQSIIGRFDALNGGFGGAPKFPQPMILEFMLREWQRTGDDEALAMTIATLRGMARGGIYDQVGGGFHRYSVDAEWLVPHFEKMLYDNALLARTYLHCYQATGDIELRRVVEEVLTYTLREMRSPEGGFYSAQDADSEGEEGRFYVWTASEVDEVLGAEDARVFRTFYDVQPGGNWEGKSIPRIRRPPEVVAAELGVEVDELDRVLERSRARLYEHRAQRVWPGLDDKVITGWHAMMVQSFAEAGRAMDREEWVQTAVEGAEFALRELRPAGRLLRTWREGTAKIDAFLEDHALLCSALMAVYEATFDPRWIVEAQALADDMLARFWDQEEGVFYDTANDAEHLIIRPRDYFDNATPSGNSAAVTALLRLVRYSGDERYEHIGLQVLESYSTIIPQMPQGFGQLLCALSFHLAPPREVAIVGARTDEATAALLGVVNTGFRPEIVIAQTDEAGAEEAVRAVPLLADRTLVGGAPAAYVCRRFTCQRPVTTPSELRELLDESA